MPGTLAFWCETPLGAYVASHPAAPPHLEVWSPRLHPVLTGIPHKPLQDLNADYAERNAITDVYRPGQCRTLITAWPSYSPVPWPVSILYSSSFWGHVLTEAHATGATVLDLEPYGDSKNWFADADPLRIQSAARTGARLSAAPLFAYGMPATNSPTVFYAPALRELCTKVIHPAYRENRIEQRRDSEDGTQLWMNDNPELGVTPERVVELIRAAPNRDWLLYANREDEAPLLLRFIRAWQKAVIEAIRGGSN